MKVRGRSFILAVVSLVVAMAAMFAFGRHRRVAPSPGNSSPSLGQGERGPRTIEVGVVDRDGRLIPHPAITCLRAERGPGESKLRRTTETLATEANGLSILRITDATRATILNAIYPGGSASTILEAPFPGRVLLDGVTHVDLSVVDPRGDPVAGALLQLSPTTQPTERPCKPGGVTDEHGRCSIDIPIDLRGPLRLDVFPPPADLRGLSAQTHLPWKPCNAQFCLSYGRWIRGSLYGDEAVIPPVRVWLSSKTRPPVSALVRGAQFAIRGPANEPSSLQVDGADSLSPPRDEPTLEISAGPEDVEVGPVHVGSARDVRVEISGAAGLRPWLVDPRSMSARYATTCDALGRAVFRGVRSSRELLVWLPPNDDGEYAQSSIAVGATELSVELTRGGEVLLLCESDAPLLYAVLRSGDLEIKGSYFKPPVGGVRFLGVAKGEWRLEVLLLDLKQGFYSRDGVKPGDRVSLAELTGSAQAMPLR